MKRDWTTGRYAPALLIALLLGVSCEGRREAETGGAVREYALRGQVVSVDAAHQTALIKHEKIGEWMEAMTMEFPVRDKNEFSTLRPGQTITATVYVPEEGTEYWIGNVKDDAAPPKNE
ncbi:MAG: copper-binding protein [Bryobacteraceae bacterium]|nr:copper-binding protein [Bryobacteraceae bacterium]